MDRNETKPNKKKTYTFPDGQMEETKKITEN